MKKLSPEKLYVEFRPDTTATQPVIPRCYTLTHSDITAELFLTIAPTYAYDKIDKMRDEVFADWRNYNDTLYLFVYVLVASQLGPAVSEIRNTIFRQELPLALEAIRYGDSKFFDVHPELDVAPIWIYFDGGNPEDSQFENWGTPKDYI